MKKIYEKPFPVTCILEKSIVERLDKVADKENRGRSFLIREGINLLLKEREKK